MEIFHSICRNVCKFYVICLGYKTVGSACTLNVYKLIGRVTLQRNRFSSLCSAQMNLTAVSI